MHLTDRHSFLCHRGHNSCSSFIFATFQSNTVTVFFAMQKMHFKMSSADGARYKIIAYDSTDKVSKDAKDKAQIRLHE